MFANFITNRKPKCLPELEINPVLKKNSISNKLTSNWLTENCPITTTRTLKYTNIILYIIYVVRTTFSLFECAVIVYSKLRGETQFNNA